MQCPDCSTTTQRQHEDVFVDMSSIQGARNVRTAYHVVRSAATYGRGDERGGLEMLSAPYREGAVAERMRFRTAAEIEAETPTEPEWIAKPWVARRAVTAVDGKPKVAGKTTWVARQVRCILTGKPFMGKPTKRTPVVYLTEEADATFRQALDRAHLLGRTDLHVLYRRDTLWLSNTSLSGMPGSSVGYGRDYDRANCLLSSGATLIGVDDTSGCSATSCGGG